MEPHQPQAVRRSRRIADKTSNTSSSHPGPQVELHADPKLGLPYDQDVFRQHRFATTQKVQQAYNWLSDIHATSIGMSARRSARNTAAKTKPRSVPTKSQDVEQPVSPLSMSARPPPEDIPASPPKSILEMTATNRDETETNSNSSKGSSSRVKDPSYRDDLKFHSIYVDTEEVLLDVEKLAQAIIVKSRTKPGPTAEDLNNCRTDIRALLKEDEPTMIVEMRHTCLFPRLSDYKDLVKTGSDIKFDRRGLPCTTEYGPGVRSVVAPKPDLQYGYTSDCFSSHQYVVMQHQRIAPYAHPSTAYYWPFFVFEFKSVSRGGTHYVAENQNAGTGAHCVNSLKTLFKMSHPQRKYRPIDTIFFSCVVDVNCATLWVHHEMEHGATNQPRFGSTKLETYVLNKTAHLQALIIAIRNIIDDALDRRLRLIKVALDAITAKCMEQWDADDRAAKVRKMPTDDDTIDEQGTVRGRKRG